jgi:hypothetical protein
VLRKPRKPSYEVAKAYRPVILLSTIAKALMAIIAEDISHLVEEYQLLPKTHFGGRPGRTTTDAIHYMVSHIKEAWRNGKVASILFLDVGAFPNTVTDRLIHNLKRTSLLLKRYSQAEEPGQCSTTSSQTHCKYSTGSDKETLYRWYCT